MIDPKYIVNLKGKEYPTWPGVLDAATKAGLKSLTTNLERLDALEKGGYLAVVKARAEFEDGRVFEDYGDAAPFNTSAMIATAAIRMASTRAKGRVLRDAINVGQTMYEELPDLRGGQGEDEEAPRQQRRQAPAQAPEPDWDREGSVAPSEDHTIYCYEGGCGVELTRDEILATRPSSRFGEAFGGHNFCTAHGKELIQIWKAKQKAEPAAA